MSNKIFKKLAFYEKILLLLSFITFLSISCQKEENGIKMKDIGSTEKIVTYFINDIEVSDEEFVIGNSDMYYVEFHTQTSDLKSSSSLELIENRAYTSEESYINFGKAYGLKFEESLAFIKIMSSFAEETGVIDEYEESGNVPSWYFERENAVYDSLFGGNVTDFKEASSLFVTFYENYFVEGQGAGDAIIMPTTAYPFMPPGWNNRVSCVEFVGLIGGGVHIFDKTFFRQMVQSVVFWGMTHVNLPSYSNDKMSSAMRI